MSALQWRWSAIGIWIALACVTFLAVGGVSQRSWFLLLATGVIPPGMLLWLWNEDRPLATARLIPRHRR